MVLGTANIYYPTVENVLVQPNFGAVIMDIQTSPANYDMFGMNLGTVLGGGGVQIYVTTNVAGYNFNVSGSYTGSALAFQGFVTTSSSEYITQVQAYSYPGFGGGAAVTDLELGTTATVPEPGSMTLVVSAGLMLLFRRRVARRRVV